MSSIGVRAYTRIMLTAVLALLLAMTLASKPVHATTFTVTRTDDPPPNGCAPSDCSLREAIIAANVNAGPDTITIPADTFTLSIPNVSGDEDAAATGDLDITGVVTITGAGANSTIIQAGTNANNGIDRVFEIVSGADVTISGVTVRHGKTVGSGGGMGNSGTLTLVNSTVSNNITSSDGGGMGNSGTLTLVNSTISGNTARNSSGGIFNYTGNVTLINSTISGNVASLSGGGLLNHHTATSVINLRNTTIAQNAADHDNNGYGYGGGISNVGSGQVTLKNTLIGDNTDKSAQAPDCSGTLTSQGYNLIENTTACIIAGDTTGNITGANPAIGPLQDYGGPTFTHALLRSRAVNAGDPAGCTDANGQLLTTDQRGVGRPQGPRCDIGAFERE